MEKIVAALWAPGSATSGDFSAQLVQDLTGALLQLGAGKVRVNVRDAAVEPASELVRVWQNPQQDAVAQFWLPSINGGMGRAGELLAGFSDRFAAWHVEETTVMPNLAHAPAVGKRTWGWSQASFLTFRPDIARSAAISHWRGHHTRIAVETQGNFEYIQNIVLAPLTGDAPPYDAFVEECFPPEAMTEPAVLYDAVGDHARLERNVKEMMESCTAFLDFSRMDIIPTSQFDFGEAPASVGKASAR